MQTHPIPAKTNAYISTLKRRKMATILVFGHPSNFRWDFIVEKPGKRAHSFHLLGPPQCRLLGFGLSEIETALSLHTQRFELGRRQNSSPVSGRSLPPVLRAWRANSLHPPSQIHINFEGAEIILQYAPAAGNVRANQLAV